MENFFIFGANYLYLLAGVIILMWCIVAPRTARKRFFLFAMISLPITFGCIKIANHVYENPRPFVVDNFTPLIPHEADNGFPSDHTALVAAGAMLLYFFNKRLSLALWAIAILVGFSRVYVGVHHPIDILASIALAIVGGVISFYIIRRISQYLPRYLSDDMTLL